MSHHIEIQVYVYPDKYPCIIVEREDYTNGYNHSIRLLKNDVDFDNITKFTDYDDPIIVHDEKLIEENKDYHYVLGTDTIYEQGQFCCEYCSGYDSSFDRAETGWRNNVDCDSCKHTMYCYCRGRHHSFTSVGQLPKDPGNNKLW